MTDTTTIAGRYRLERRLGLGGMSTVHLAFDSRLERYVAVKLLAEHLAQDPSFVSRFRREALAAARLVHPNVVQVFDFGFEERSGRHFIVMEHVDGHSGAELLRDHGRLGVDETIAIVTQACRGLDYAHRSGVVHRDVKPGNLLRAHDGGVKLADFGIAKATEQASITQVGSVLGTAAYLAPEQARGEEAGPAGDLYSLGVVTYQLLSGRLPYEASSLSELTLKQQRELPPSLDVVVPEVAPTLGQAVAMALSIDPDDRPTDAAALERALREGADGKRPLGIPAVPTAVPSTASTRVLAGERDTAATRVVTRPRTAAVGPSPRRPRPGPPPARAAERAPAAAPPERTRRGARRFAALLLVLLVLVGAAVAILATSSSKQGVQLRKVAGREARSVIEQMQTLIDDNTK